MRLQGKEFANIKHLLKLWGFSITKNNNIKVYCRFKRKYYYKVTHYLNDVEKEKFINSQYFKDSVARTKRTKYGQIIFSDPNHSHKTTSFDYSTKPKLNVDKQ